MMFSDKSLKSSLWDSDYHIEQLLRKGKECLDIVVPELYRCIMQLDISSHDIWYCKIFYEEISHYFHKDVVYELLRLKMF